MIVPASMPSGTPVTSFGFAAAMELNSLSPPDACSANACSRVRPLGSRVSLPPRQAKPPPDGAAEAAALRLVCQQLEFHPPRHHLRRHDVPDQPQTFQNEDQPPARIRLVRREADA